MLMWAIVPFGSPGRTVATSQSGSASFAIIFGVVSPLLAAPCACAVPSLAHDTVSATARAIATRIHLTCAVPPSGRIPNLPLCTAAEAGSRVSKDWRTPPSINNNASAALPDARKLDYLKNPKRKGEIEPAAWLGWCGGEYLGLKARYIKA